MTTLLATPPSNDVATRSSPTAACGPVIVAVDGTDGSAGAIRAAELLANRGAAHTGVVTALEVDQPDMGLAAGALPGVGDARCELLERVLVQLANASPVSREWRIDVDCGDSALVLARAAAQRSAHLILMGLGRHRIIDRFLGAETTVRTLNRTNTPVLAVPPAFDRLPTRAVVATDFGPSSLRAARLALELFPSLSEVFVVHVAPLDEIGPVVAFARHDHDDLVDEEIERFRAQLDPRGALPIETVVLLGSPAHELLAFSKRVEADLIVAGSHGVQQRSRSLLGSTVTRLLRGAECAVLTVPEPPGPPE